MPANAPTPVPTTAPRELLETLRNAEEYEARLRTGGFSMVERNRAAAAVYYARRAVEAAAPLPTAPEPHHACAFPCPECDPEHAATAPEPTPELTELLDALVSVVYHRGRHRDTLADLPARTAIEARFAALAHERAVAFALCNDLEAAQDKAEALAASLAQVEGERDALTRALGFYADDKAWKTLDYHRVGEDCVHYASAVVADGGDLARAALGSSRSGASHG